MTKSIVIQSRNTRQSEKMSASADGFIFFPPLFLLRRYLSNSDSNQKNVEGIFSTKLKNGRIDSEQDKRQTKDLSKHLFFYLIFTIK